MITIRTANFEVEGSVEEILLLFSQLDFGASIEPVEEPPAVTVVRDQQQTTLTAYKAFKQRSSGQEGMTKAKYHTGRKIHCCSRCGAEHRHMNKTTGRCKSCPVEEVAL